MDGKISRKTTGSKKGTLTIECRRSPIIYENDPVLQQFHSTSITNIVPTNIYVLTVFDHKKPLYSKIDVSPFKLAAILLYRVNSKVRPVAFIFRIFTKPKRNYRYLDKEIKNPLLYFWATKNSILSIPL